MDTEEDWVETAEEEDRVRVDCRLSETKVEIPKLRTVSVLGSAVIIMVVRSVTVTVMNIGDDVVFVDIVKKKDYASRLGYRNAVIFHPT